MKDSHDDSQLSSTKDCMTKYYEIQMDKELRSAHLRTENEKQNVFDSERSE